MCIIFYLDFQLSHKQNIEQKNIILPSSDLKYAQIFLSFFYSLKVALILYSQRESCVSGTSAKVKWWKDGDRIWSAKVKQIWSCIAKV